MASTGAAPPPPPPPRFVEEEEAGAGAGALALFFPKRLNIDMGEALRGWGGASRDLWSKRRHHD